ncbi:MAG: dihydroorotate dehydrogenase electron transfer subunit [Vicinamibacteria bacterium]|nr:dihydroorotate dehydrogenase electron transfer subunit [Vicinamibacteria bacterium]
MTGVVGRLVEWTAPCPTAIIQSMPSDLDAALVERHSIGDAFHVLVFEHGDVARNSRPGQFVMLKPGRSTALPLRRPFSIMDVDAERETFSVFMKVVGAQTQALAHLRIGQTARCLGPLGRSFQSPQSPSLPLLIGGGFGIAPLLLLGAVLRRDAYEPRVFYGGRTIADLALRRTLEDLGFSLVLATEDGSLGFKGLITAALEEHLDSCTLPTSLFACGPGPMLAAVARIAARRGLPAQVSVDPWMGCGMGTCLGCVVPTRKANEERPRYRCACTEGPVFESSEVVWTDDRASPSRARETTP